ncbi:MAG: class I SAM-dependent methyltransferase [Chloroflexota bacterium]
MPRLFSWMQEAEFYYDLHAQAVSLLPKALGRQQWIDVGCGPGLITRLAAARGYQALGIDVNPQMIAAAEQIAQHEKSSATFRLGNFEDIPYESASVISAASLLAVLPDPMAGLLLLWRSVRPGGSLLIIEPTAEMTVEHAHHLIQNGIPAKRKYGLYLWASARQGRAVDSSLYSRLQSSKLDYIPLLHGLVGAWVLHKG